VVDILRKLKAQGCEVDVADPWAYTEESKNEYRLNLIGGRADDVGDLSIDLATFYKKLPTRKYHGIVVAVAHKQFAQITPSQMRKLGIDENCTIFDLKHVLNKRDSDIRL
jgi:UDP-N-acetyl-D-galactosamine dehydrogenase